MIGCNLETDPVVIWENQQASSTNCGCPIRILYKRKTAQLIRDETEDAEVEINNLQQFIFENVVCNFKMYITMDDGKAISALTQIPSMNCHICLCKPSQMNELSSTTGDIEPENLKYGLMTMHAWMKFMERVLHMSYYLELKKPTKAGVSRRNYTMH